MQYDTSEVDALMGDDTQGAALESDPRGYEETINSLKEKIDINMNIMFNYVESFKASKPTEYVSLAKEYADISDQYKKDLYGAANAQPAQYDQWIKTLQLDLDYTNTNVQNIKNQTVNMPAEQKVEQEGQPGTAMVLRKEPPTIVMENVGPLRAFWEGLNPSFKLVTKAVTIGAVLYGLKVGWDYYTKTKGTTRTTNPRKRKRVRKNYDYEEE